MGTLFRGGRLPEGEQLINYNEKLDIPKAAKMIKDRTLIWKAMEMDFKQADDIDVDSYLKHIKTSSQGYLNNQSKICDREYIKTTLQDICSDKGKLVFLTGGPSVGKSLLLKKLVDDVPEGQVVAVDGRAGTGSNFEAALASTLRAHPNMLRDAVVKGFLKDVVGLMDVAGTLSKMQSVVALQSYFASTPEGVETFLTVLSNNYAPFTLIVDEANVYFNSDNPGNVTNILRLLTLMSKQRRMMNVILTSSEFSFPYQLGELGYNTAHIKQHLFMSDVPPADAFKLLTEEWHVRPHLATALINHFGGHVLSLARAVSSIAFDKQQYLVFETYGPSLRGCVTGCISAAQKNDALKNRIIPALKQLAVTGFFPLEKEDDLGKLIAKHGVGGFVPHSTTMPSLSDKVRKDESGIVPSLELIRMVIAIVLGERKEKLDS